MSNNELHGVLIPKNNKKAKIHAAFYSDKPIGGGGTSDYSQLTNKPTINGVELDGNLNSSDLGIENLVSVTYEELKNLRSKARLIPGRQYRITNYECTTVQQDTISANHRFDIIVWADDVNILNEDAYAIKHKGDSYFSQNNFSAWKLKYCLDNDNTRFAWANENSGKGVVYYMKDEFNNEAPYDFKNIQILSGKDYVYTFGDSYDDFSIVCNTCHNNTIKPLLDGNGLYTINMINISKPQCFSVSFEQDCKNIILNCVCQHVQFGNGCEDIIIQKGMVNLLAASVIFAGTKNLEIQEVNQGTIMNCHVFSGDYKGDSAVVDMENLQKCSIKIYRKYGGTVVDFA